MSSTSAHFTFSSCWPSPASPLLFTSDCRTRQSEPRMLQGGILLALKRKHAPRRLNSGHFVEELGHASGPPAALSGQTSRAYVAAALARETTTVEELLPRSLKNVVIFVMPPCRLQLCVVPVLAPPYYPHL